METAAEIVAGVAAEGAAEVLIDRLYVLHEALGAGGMGTVYRATHRLSGQPVALKLIHNKSAEAYKDTDSTTAPSDGSSEGVQLRLALEREFEVLASLHHPHIVRVLDYGFIKVRGPYLVMELLPAARNLIDAGVEASYSTRIAWIGQLLLALAYLHRRGVIHRDIKPSNVLCVNGQVKVVDFGIALHGEVAEGIAGTLGYMAPELLIGDAPSIASDLYSVGVLSYELLTGCAANPPAGSTKPRQEPGSQADQTVPVDVAEFLEANRSFSRVREQFELDDGFCLLRTLDLPLQPVLARLLARSPSVRYADALEVLRDFGSATGLALAEETAETRESFLQAATLVGRDRELNELTSALRQARSGRGSSWLIGGESGVGKSRIVDELRTLALIRGARVLRGQAVREGGGPFHVFLEILERLCLSVPLDDQALGVLLPILPRLAGLLSCATPELPALDARSMQERAFLAILGVFESASGDSRHPLVILLEDLHWIGKESQALLERLAALAPERALLIIGTFRDDESPDLPAAIPKAEVMRLRRLDDESIASLCESMLGSAGRSPELIEFLRRESEGNPFFIVEIMRALADEAGYLGAVSQRRLPDHILTGGVRAVLDRRIGLVPAWAQPMLELAAAAGRLLDSTMLAHSATVAALGEHSLDAWLLRCSSMSIIDFRDQRWRFSHDKLRERLLERLRAAGRLPALHFEIAQALESAYSGPSLDEQSVRLVYHCLEAGSLVAADKLSEVALRAAKREIQQLSFDEAAGMLERVMAVLEPGELAELHRYELFLVLGQAHIRAGNHDRGKAACERAAELARRLADPVLLARAALTYGSEFSLGGTDPKMVALLEESLRGLSQSDHPLRARALARLAAALQPAPDPEPPVAMAREAVAMARRLGDAEVLRATLISACSALVTFGPPRERLELDLESVQLAERAHDRVQLLRGHLRLVFDYAELGDMAGLDASTRAYEHGAREFRQPQYQWPVLMLRAMRSLMDGRFAESDLLSEEVRGLGERHQDFNAIFTARLHRLARFHIGELHPELLSAETELRPPLTRIFAKQIHLQQAITVWCQARAGRSEQVRVGLAVLRDSSALLRNRFFLPLLAEACLQTGDAAFAEQIYDRILAERESFWPVQYSAGMAYFPPYTQPLGILAMTLGRFQDAVEHLADALRRSESIKLRSHLARLRCEYAMALLGRGQADDAERAGELLTSARALASELGQTGLLPLIDKHAARAAAHRS